MTKVTFSEKKFIYPSIKISNIKINGLLQIFFTFYKEFMQENHKDFKN